MTGIDRYLGAIFARETAELRRVVDVGRARGWLWKGPRKPEGALCPTAKKKPASKAGGRKGRR